MTDHELASELRKLAAHSCLTIHRDQLRDLAGAMTDSDKAERWCEVDLFAAFSPEDIILPNGGEAVKSRRMPRGLFTIVNSVLVFLPIFITWLGLMMATGAYGETLTANGSEAARRPFLEMWQQGFDGRLPAFFKFDNIAFCTLSAIGFLILCTIIENVMRNKAEDKSELDLAVLRAHLRRALTQASLVLGQVRLSSPARFGAELTKTVADINSVSTTARKMQTELIEALTQTLTSTRKTTEALAAGAVDVRGAVEVIGKHLANIDIAYEDMTAAMEQASATIDAVGSKTGQAVTDVGDQLSTTLSRTILDMRQAFNDELARSTQSVQGIVSGLNTRVSELDAHLGELVGATASIEHAVDRAAISIDSGVQGAVSGLDARVGELDNRVGELVDATASIGYAVDRAAISIDSVGSSTEKAVGLIGGQVTDSLTITAGEFRRTFADTGTEIREALGDWASTAGAHASRIELVSDTSGRTVTLLEQTRDTLDRLPIAIANVLDGLPAKVQELTDGEFAELKDAITQLNYAVDRAADVFSTSAPGSAPKVPEGGLW